MANAIFRTIFDTVNCTFDLAAKSTKKYLQMSDASLLPRPFSGKVVVDGSALVITMRGVERSSLVLLSFTAAAV